MSYEDKIRWKLQKLIEEKSTEVQRNNNSKLETVKKKLRRMQEIENLLDIIVATMNGVLSDHNKTLKVKGNTEQLLKVMDNLDPKDPEMKIPNEEVKIGVGYQNAKTAKAYARATIGLPLGADKVSASLDDKIIWNNDFANLSNEMIEDFVFKMINDVKW
jgi:hypothetical protein